MIIKTWIGVVLLSIFSAVTASATCTDIPPKSLIFSQIEGSPVQRKGVDLIREIYQSLGIEIDFVVLPPRRALELSNAGITDGELFRIQAVAATQPHLVQIPTPVLNLHGYAYSVNGVAFNSLSEIKNLRVGIHGGLVWAEKAVHGMKHVVRSETTEDLLEKLLRGGVDVVITVEDDFQKRLKKLGKDMLATRGGPIISFPVYHYLHSNFACLVNKVDRKIQEINKR